MKKLNTILIVLLTLGTSSASANALSATPARNAAGSPSLPLLFGAYTSLDLQSSAQELVDMNAWLTGNGASGVTFAGDFMSITLNPAWNVPHELNAAWDNGFLPFVNLTPSESWEGAYYDSNCVTATQIAAGLCNAKIALWANEFKNWAGANKRAFIAPLPEMNGNWTAYSSDGATFIQAFIQIRQVFEDQGVPRSAVRWVFAPNGWNDPAYPWKQFEHFYPGDEYTDIVAFSAYNYGGCPTQYASWDTFDTAMKPYLDRMRAMASSKPIFIAQTGVLAVPVNPGDPNQTKSAWVEDIFSRLADYPAVRAIIYFNKINTYEVVGNCAAPDYRIYYGGSNGEAGFLNIMKDSRFGKWSTESGNWRDIAFLDLVYTFADVQPNHPFSGEANVWYYDAVHSLYNAGITGGCSVDPLKYCPDNSVTRAQMSVFLLRGIHGSGFTPPDVGDNTGFNDVPTTYWSAAWIKQLAAEGITGGCGGGNYCPENPVTRAQMAVFLLKSKYGSSYNPPPVDSGTGFEDVPTTYWSAAWIKQLAAEGITGGCGGGNYCPESPVTRAQMAVFLVRTFNLP